MPARSDRLGELGEVARVLNLGRASDADKLLAAIEADKDHLVWKDVPIAANYLRERINLALKEKP